MQSVFVLLLKQYGNKWTKYHRPKKKKNEALIWPKVTTDWSNSPANHCSVDLWRVSMSSSCHVVAQFLITPSPSDFLFCRHLILLSLCPLHLNPHNIASTHPHPPPFLILYLIRSLYPRPSSPQSRPLCCRLSLSSSTSTRMPAPARTTALTSLPCLPIAKRTNPAHETFLTPCASKNKKKHRRQPSPRSVFLFESANTDALLPGRKDSNRPWHLNPVSNQDKDLPLKSVLSHSFSLSHRCRFSVISSSRRWSLKHRQPRFVPVMSLAQRFNDTPRCLRIYVKGK